MDNKFWNDVYKTTKPWVLSVILISFIISVVLHPKDYLEVFKYILRLPLVIFSKIISNEFINNLLSFFTISFLANLGLRLLDPIKFPLKWRKIFSSFFLIWALISFLYLLIHLK